MWSCASCSNLGDVRVIQRAHREAGGGRLEEPDPGGKTDMISRRTDVKRKIFVKEWRL